MTMMIPICAPTNDAEAAGKLEWVMLELNGELLKPLDQSLRGASQSQPSGDYDNDMRRRVELGSVKIDADVSKQCTRLLAIVGKW